MVSTIRFTATRTTIRMTILVHQRVPWTATRRDPPSDPLPTPTGPLLGAGSAPPGGVREDVADGAGQAPGPSPVMSQSPWRTACTTRTRAGRRRRDQGPGTSRPGHARRRRSPWQRKGPARAQPGRCQVRRRPGLPRRLVRRDDPLDRRARRFDGSTSTRPSTGPRSWSSPRPTSRATTSSARSRTTSRSSSRSAARSSTTPSRSRCSPRRTARRSARRRHAHDAADDAAAARLRPARSPTTSSPTTRSHRATSTPALAAADLVLEGEYRVGHQEQLYIENNAMIAVPREDGGVTVHGSLQCPYYVHKALKRGLGLDDEQARVVQAETGGGFGGKEEYPSIIALHAALLAGKARRPVRMIYDRHEDIAATTKRHPAIVRHRTGVTRDGRLVAQDIEVVMDGGAYCTLTPVVLSRGAIHAGGPYRCPNVRIRARATRDQHAAERRVPRLRRAADRVRGRDPPQPRSPRRSACQPARDPPAERLPARRHDADRPGPARAAWPARRSSSAPPRRPSSSGIRARTTRGRGAARGLGHRCPARRCAPARDDGARHRARAGLARRRVHRLGRGPARLGRVARADRRRPDPRS